MSGLCLPLLALFLSGCLDEETTRPEACRHAVAQDLDAGWFDSALERLASPACEAAMTAEELEMNRAAAYIGKARYDVADLLLVVLGASNDADTDNADLRLLQALTGLGAPGGGVRYLAEANRAHEQMMTAFPGGLDQACRGDNVLLLSRLQRDACFHSGLLAYARLARTFDLLLHNQLAAFLGLVPLDCSNDRNFSGIADEAEISACALHARTRLGAGAGICRASGTRAGLTRGGVTWERIAGVEQTAFFEDGTHFATLIPVRITVQAGGVCEDDRHAMRLFQAAPSMQMVISDGYCEAEVTRPCAAGDPDHGCWPCPIPRLRGEGSMSVSETLLSAINVEAERWLDVLNPRDASNAAEDLRAFREALCEGPGEPDERCERSEEGEPRVTREALREYLGR